MLERRGQRIRSQDQKHAGELALAHMGLGPFCEVAHLTVNDVTEAKHGMMWRVYSSKARKTRKIPVREVVELVRQVPLGRFP